MFCTQPYNHLDILVENEKISYLPCTVWTGPTIAPHHYREKIKNIQSTLKDGFDKKHCEICRHNEHGGVISKRQAHNQITQDNNLSLEKIQSIGLRYGTLCNLKCMICDVGSSSNWYSDSVKLGLDIQPQYKYNKKLIPSVDKVFENIDIKQIKYVAFHGGEPLIQPYPKDFLTRANRKEISVMFNTNGSIFPDDTLMELLNECKSVHFLLSIDDIGDRFSMLRYPNKWSVVEENIKKFKSTKHSVGVTNCVSALNVWYMDEFYKWAIPNFGTSIDTQFVFFPQHLNIQTMSPKLKKLVDAKFDALGGPFKRIVEVMDQDNSKDLTQDMINYIASLDAIRNTSFAEVFPEWNNLLSL
jgi:sulfatase maturation enzyme AslB (radical SAM superfamily)